MLKLHNCLLATACVALVGAAGFAPGAGAATCNGDTNCSLGTQPYTFGANDLFAGGSSLIAPYWRQEGDCYAEPADLITKGTPPTYVDEDLFDWKGSHPQNCATTQINTSATSWYISTGSGSGILAVMTHDPVSFWGIVNEANGDQYFPYVSFANSDAGLGSSDVNVYDNGTGSGTYCQGSTCVTIAAPGALECAGEQDGVYPNPLQCYGPLIQFPLSIDPVAVFYTNKGVYERISGAGKKEIDYHLNIQHGTKDGGLLLSIDSLCGIYNGEITNWNDPQLTQDNDGVSLKDPNDPTSASSWSVPLAAVARSDGSGTTSIHTRHLANVCQSFTLAGGQDPVNYYTTGATTIQAAGASAIAGNTYNVNNPNYPGVDQPGLITLAPNSSGVAQYVAFTQSPQGEKNQCSKGTQLPSGYTDCIQQSRVGYVGADYVMPYVKNSQTNSYNLFSAALQNYQGQYIAPSPKSALIAFGSAQPPQTNSQGQYCASCTTYGLRNDPTAWVEGLSPTEPLANPTASGAYPNVGTTQMEAYTCYANSTTLSNFLGLINWRETAKITTNKKGILGDAGLSPLPAQWTKAIDDAFYSNADNLNLEPSVGLGSNPNCTDVTGA
jgi:phosphate transport system substrate-binding protein